MANGRKKSTRRQPARGAKTQTEDLKLAQEALKKARAHVKWNKPEPKLYQGIKSELHSIIADAQRAIQAKDARKATQMIIAIFELADEEDMFDKRCKYPGCGSEIQKLVEKY